MVADAVNWKPHDRRQPFPVGAILDGLDESERLLHVGTLAIPRRPGRLRRPRASRSLTQRLVV
jgi:hypothetical protein